MQEEKKGISPALQDWIARLQDKPLPAMALTVQRVTQLIDSPNTTNADYQRIISRDPGFTLSIFRAFSANNRSPKAPASNLAHAIALLGLAPVIAGTKQLPILKKMLHGKARQGLYGCYSKATHAACYAYSWGQQRKENNPEEMAIAALLHDCGEMALWAYAREEMKKFHVLVSRGEARHVAAEEIFGFTLEQLSLALAEQWKLPALTIDALQHYGAFHPRSLGVMLACELATESARDWNSDTTFELYQLVADYQGKSIDQAVANVHCQAADIARSLHGLPLPVSADCLLQLQPATDKPRSIPSKQQPRIARQDEPPAPEKTSKAPARASTTEKPMTAAPRADKKQTPAGNGLQQKISLVMQDMMDTAGLERVMFAMLTPDRKSIRSRFVVGGDQDDQLRKLDISLEQRHLFSVLVAKQQGFWLNSGNRQKYAQLLPENIANSLHSNSFFASSLYLRNKPIGILYADCSDPNDLNSHNFSQFKQLSQRLCNDLGQ